MHRADSTIAVLEKSYLYRPALKCCCERYILHRAYAPPSPPLAARPMRCHKRRLVAPPTAPKR